MAFALNMHQKDVDVRVKRVGGGFGGKATRFFMYAAAALAAKLLNKFVPPPARPAARPRPLCSAAPQTDNVQATNR